MTLKEVLYTLPARQVVRVGADSGYIAITEAGEMPLAMAWWQEEYRSTYERLLQQQRRCVKNLLDNGLRIPGLAAVNGDLKLRGGYKSKRGEPQKPGEPIPQMEWQEYATDFLRFQQARVADYSKRIFHEQRALRRAEKRVKDFVPFLDREVTERRFSKEHPDELILLVQTCGTHDEGLFWDRGEYESWEALKQVPEESGNKPGAGGGTENKPAAGGGMQETGGRREDGFPWIAILARAR